MKLSLPLFTAGTITLILAHHSILGILIGAGLLMSGWLNLELREGANG